MNPLSLQPIANSHLFWLEESDLPPGSGYPLFGIGHISCLIAALSVVCISTAIFSLEIEEKRRNAYIKNIPILLIIPDVLKICVLTAVGGMGIGHLPLHLCSMSTYIYPVPKYGYRLRFL